tara:strand:- start:729 stop:929 length:201 start_codon:yes stop_codon:yes gene_type:complete
MSYHDGYDPRNEGISVVNPLKQIQLKLDKITHLVNEIVTTENNNSEYVSMKYIEQLRAIVNDEEKS